MAGDREERLFGKSEADALLPRLRELIGGLQRAAGSGATARGRGRMARAGRSNGSAHAAAAAFQSSAEIRRLLEEVEELGVILRDLAGGLCDFPALRAGEPVFLCWRMGEPEVAWWHPRDQGFAGRLPL